MCTQEASETALSKVWDTQESADKNVTLSVIIVTPVPVAQWFLGYHSQANHLQRTPLCTPEEMMGSVN